MQLPETLTYSVFKFVKPPHSLQELQLKPLHIVYLNSESKSLICFT